MKDDVLFEVTRECLETGLRGYPVGYCPSSYVEPMKGLYYMDRPISELAHSSPEAVIYLLWYGREANPSELQAFKAELQKRGTLSKSLVDACLQLPKQGQPLKLLSMELLLTSVFEGKNDFREDGLNLIAKIPALTAMMINHHAGWGQKNPSRPELGYIENFVQMLNLPKAPAKGFLEVMKLFNILHYDHGGGNLSTFVGKSIASGLQDMYGSIAGALLALEGPRHGRANQDCLDFVEEIRKSAGDNASVEIIEAIIRKKLANNELIFGFGHAVLRVEDPRATIFYKIAETQYGDHPLVKLAINLRTAGIKVLSENPKISDPYPNVDAISGIVVMAAGFPYPEYLPALFGLSRAVGIARQIIYERCEARGGKGTPIVRPKYFYLGNENVAG